VGGIIGLLPGREMAAGSTASRRSNLQIVIVGDMAVGAGVDFAGRRGLVQILQWESRGIVIPGRSPIRGGVARGALRRGESGSHVIWNGAAHGSRALVFILVATIAIGVGGGEVVIVIEVAVGAGRCGVNAGESPASGAVIKGGGGPGNRVVAGGAIGGGERSARGSVGGIIGLLPGGEVTSGISAIVRLNLKRVIIVDMASGAACCFTGRSELMGISEREAGGAVIERGARPGQSVVTDGALGRGEARRDVIGNIAAESLRLVPVRGVATVAIGVGGTERVVVVEVAICAGRDFSSRSELVGIGERPTGGAVIERGRTPGNRVMAGGAVGGSEWGARGSVGGILGLLPGGEVASGVSAIVGLCSEIVVAAHVAIGTSSDFARGCELMRIGKREAGAGVIEFSVGPGGDGVASGASRSSRREIGCDVIGDVTAESLGLVPVWLMTGETIRGVQRIIVVDVAVGARGSLVRTNEREAGDAVVKGSAVPTFGSVAIRTIGCGKGGTGTGMDRSRRLLPLGQVATRIAAIGGSGLQGEVVVDMAICARNIEMAVGQGKSGTGVIKFSIGPGGDGMAGGASGGGGGEA
jgi:hypothetical protein